MTNDNMKKIMSVICAMGAVIVCLVMIYFEIVDNHIPALVWLASSVFMFGNAALIRMNKKQASSDEAK